MINKTLCILILSLSVGGNALARGDAAMMVGAADAEKGMAFSAAAAVGNDRREHVGSDLSIDTTPTSNASLDAVCTSHMVHKGYAVTPL